MVEPKMVRALTSFGVAMPKSKITREPYRVIHEGDLFAATDKLVKKHPHLFGPVEGVRVEQATAAPGEVRNVVLPDSEDVSD